MADRDWDRMIDGLERAVKRETLQMRSFDIAEYTTARTALREAIAELERERDALKSRLAAAEKEAAHYRGFAGDE